MGKKKTTKAKKPVKKAVKKTAAQTPKKVAKKAVKKTAKKTVKKTTKKVVKKAAKKTASKPAKKTTKKTVKKAAKKTAKKIVEKAAKKSVKKATAKPARKTVKKTVKKAVKKAAPKKTTAPAKKAKVSAAKPVKKTAAKKKGGVTRPMKKGILEGYMPTGYYNGILLCENPKPFPLKTPYTEKELDKLRKKLEEERTRLREILRDLDAIAFHPDQENANISPGYSIHPAEDATNNIDMETALLIRKDEANALLQVEAAIERMEEGVYGVCMASGQKIGMSRLKAVPEAHLCMECQILYDEKKSKAH